MTRVSVFAVEDTAAQVCWAGLPAGTTLWAGDSVVEVDVDDAPGAGVLAPLPPDSRLDLAVQRPGGRARLAASFSTLAPPPGQLLCRFATVNDVHVGARHFGILKTISEDSVPDGAPHPVRCLRAALREAVAWGAEAIFAKGDLTHGARAAQWETVGRLLSGAPVPVAATLGNHDVVRSGVDGRAALAQFGIDIPEEAYFRDLLGIRVVLAHTAMPGHRRGQVTNRERDRVRELVATAGGPALVAMHHHPQRFRFPLKYPPGIPGEEARPLLDAVSAANAATMVTTGHSHRNRLHHHGPVPVVEVGSTLHYPGTWAGYAVHEGGIRQVVRRVAAPDAIAWTERTRRAVLGIWGLWAPGRRSERCFSHTWPRPA